MVTFGLFKIKWISRFQADNEIIDKGYSSSSDNVSNI